jgi:hypothetical protein
VNELALSWEHQNRAIAALQRQFALGIGPRIQTDDGNILPFHALRIYIGHVDPDTEFEIAWRWKLVGGSEKSTAGETWIFARDRSRVAPQLGPRMRTVEGEPCFDVGIPPVVLDGRSTGFVYIRAQVRKRYRLGRDAREIPHDGPMMITTQEGLKEPEADTRVLSLEYVQPK